MAVLPTTALRAQVRATAAYPAMARPAMACPAAPCPTGLCRTPAPLTPDLRTPDPRTASLHLAASRECTEALLEAGTTAIGYETVELSDGSLPLLAPMSEVVGRMAPQAGAHHLQREHERNYPSYALAA